MRRNNRGFTLVELLLSAVLAAVVSLAIFANFSAGMRLWKALNGQNANEDIDLFLQRGSSDFLRTMRYSSVPMTGDDKSVDFAAAIDADPSLGGDRGIGQLRYAFDEPHRILVRTEKDMHEIAAERPGRSVPVLQNVRSVKISYFGLDKSDNEVHWQESWQGPEVPLAVRFEIKLAEDSLVKTFRVPVGGH